MDAYIGPANCCKTEAARLAGYATPGQEGYRLYKDAEVRAAIEERMRELAISPEEILQRLSEQARGNTADFIEVLGPGSFRIDLAQAEQSGKLRRVKKAGYDPKGRADAEVPAGEVVGGSGALGDGDVRAYQVVTWTTLNCAVWRQPITSAFGKPVRRQHSSWRSSLW